MNKVNNFFEKKQDEKDEKFIFSEEKDEKVGTSSIGEESKQGSDEEKDAAPKG